MPLRQTTGTSSISSPIIKLTPLKCIHNDRPPCKRCKDRAEECLFPPPGTSSLHRGGKVRHSLEQQQLRRSQQNREVRSEEPTQRQSDSTVYQRQVARNSTASSSAGGSSDVSHLDPYDLFTDEVKNSYLRCAYKWSFHHIPSLLLAVRNGSLDDGMLWAILALAIRFTTSAPPPFPTPISASNAFAAHARSLLLPSISNPTLSKIQGLLMVTGHSWGAGEARQAWIYLGVALRMAQVVGLFSPSPDEDAQTDSDGFIRAEERRRTAWTCFLMDSLLSGGVNRKRSLSAADMNIALPCDFEPFQYGEPVEVPLMSTFSAGLVTHESEKLGIIAQSMLAADIWGSVAQWACSPSVETELPWLATSQFQNLFTKVELWKRGLPRRLSFNMDSLRAHSAMNQGQAWCYMHSIYFMSIMFLHRAYLSPSSSKATEESETWQAWRRKSRKDLLKVTEDVCTMYEEMRDSGLFFLRGLVPWIGFTVYTATGIMLYFYHFSEEQEDHHRIRERAKKHVVEGCEFLKDMKGSWPMADNWVSLSS
jgi:Fungal specific transcription factor domain